MKETVYRFGQHAEDLAAHYLQSCGYSILQSRFRTREGEVDLIACRDDRLIFAEVKARTSTYFGTGIDAVEPLKLLRLTRVAAAYLERVHWEGDFQIDVIDFRFSRNGALLGLKHLQDVSD